ncbi:MAG TPA: prepilin-type N-terminal cleavage/methylation domain-containing protein [Thermoanaerobaculia bacterium]|jgi:general secretion pathway protein G
MHRDKSSRGFTLVEILVVIAIIGILAIAGIYNYMSAITRTRQKRTMADIRVIALAWEQRAIEARSYAVSGFTYPTTNVPYASLQGILRPTYAKELPSLDGWGKPLQFAIDAQGDTYAIRSSGRDGVFETEYPDVVTDDPDCDIVYSAGNFVVYPDTMQKD